MYDMKYKTLEHFLSLSLSNAFVKNATLIYSKCNSYRHESREGLNLVQLYTKTSSNFFYASLERLGDVDVLAGNQSQHFRIRIAQQYVEVLDSIHTLQGTPVAKPEDLSNDVPISFLLWPAKEKEGRKRKGTHIISTPNAPAKHARHKPLNRLCRRSTQHARRRIRRQRKLGPHNDVRDPLLKAVRKRIHRRPHIARLAERRCAQRLACRLRRPAQPCQQLGDRPACAAAGRVHGFAIVSERGGRAAEALDRVRFCSSPVRFISRFKYDTGMESPYG